VNGAVVGLSLASLGTAIVFRKPFYRRLTASVKTAPFAIATLFGFGVAGERRLLVDRRVIEEQRMAAVGPFDAVELEPLRSEGLVSWPRDHPFKALAVFGAPTVGAILYRTLNSGRLGCAALLRNLTSSTCAGLANSAGGRASVAFMHTRVVGQFSILALLVGAMLLSGRG
jgi:hypothetical protein